MDAALESGQVVSTSFDPMLGKVIASGADRESARRTLVAALDETAILGLTTNVGFLRELAASDAFRDATIDTAWLDRHEVPAPPDELARLMAAWTDVEIIQLTSAPEPFAPDGWRVGSDPAPIPVALDRVVVVDRHRGTATDGDRVARMATLEAANHGVLLEIDGRRIRAVVNADRHAIDVALHGQRFLFERADPFADHGPEIGDGTVVAPMPGTVLAVRVAPGDHVESGQTLGMMEAMKMELSLTAPFAGTVTQVDAADGAQVALGDRLFVVVPAEEG